MRFPTTMLLLLALSNSAYLFSSSPLKSVSIIELIARPERNEGHRVMLTGFLHLEFEGDALYLHNDDYRFHIYKNAIWVNLPENLRPIAEKYNNRYVYLVGSFTAKKKGHCGLFSGEIYRITSIEIQEPKTQSNIFN